MPACARTSTRPGIYCAPTAYPDLRYPNRSEAESCYHIMCESCYHISMLWPCLMQIWLPNSNLANLVIYGVENQCYLVRINAIMQIIIQNSYRNNEDGPRVQGPGSYAYEHLRCFRLYCHIITKTRCFTRCLGIQDFSQYFPYRLPIGPLRGSLLIRVIPHEVWDARVCSHQHKAGNLLCANGLS